ncbi:hypothetical protein DICVIV_12384 [Dictyocaulus viviparus]|uniref:Ig-like domain-containing protein n=1 Tax=Dictyocaulus viviparus TaxID=29172 RepID=A0A0D8XH08_DICVI|nr:hypothetical protein DICVIV_12384 [Dictyocaulus viviparus]
MQGFLETNSLVIKSVIAFSNGSVMIEFEPTANADLTTLQNQTVEYREVAEHVEGSKNWTRFEFQWKRLVKIDSTTVKCLLMGEQLPKIALDPESIFVDPDVSLYLEVRCDVTSTTLLDIHWLVDGQSINDDHPFYTVSNVTVNDHLTSFELAASEIACVAVLSQSVTEQGMVI